MIKHDTQGCQFELKIAEGGPGSRGQAQKHRKPHRPLLLVKERIKKNIRSRPQRPSGLPDGPGSELKRVMMGPKLRTRVDMAPEPG